MRTAACSESPVQPATNQNVRLINPHSGEEVGCRVVRVVGPTLASYEVAFEFHERAPQFWQNQFSPRRLGRDRRVRKSSLNATLGRTVRERISTSAGKPL